MPIPVLVGSPPAKNSITFRGLNVNNPNDEEKSTYVIEDISESDAFQQVVEPFPDRDGSQAYQPYVMSKIFRVRGWVRGQTLRELYDKIRAINEAFHPVKAYLADSATYNRGYFPITFDVPTADTANYATGLVPSQYYVQALRLPVPSMSKFGGFNARIDFMLRAVDPRRYWQTASSANRTGNGAITCVNSLAGYPSFPIIQIVTTTAPSGTPTIARTSPSGGTVSFVSAQLAGATTYNLDMQAKTFKTAAGTNKETAIVGGSAYFDIQDGVSNTITLAGWPADVVVTVNWVRAFL